MPSLSITIIIDPNALDPKKGDYHHEYRSHWTG